MSLHTTSTNRTTSEAAWGTIEKLCDLPELHIRVKLGKKIYLYNRYKIIQAIDTNLTYSEKTEVLNALSNIVHRKGDISSYIRVVLIGIIVRQESNTFKNSEYNVL
ncbi:hypothetical protein IMZ08_05705 [Bacillus luteolus]|uniref:Uncharacterized protein n=1 Tax=Litchfieldia luteola TaxID=682179 RepID=A0ABR9QGG2_9BACI|nr:hypothetical protein [Cytobacillus luteolus]MBE4907558.1 hypothetical protein [Cytobacillus luteolus]MBP1944331.1 hypothetical protein [Cytobacillus luteolus]